MRLNGAHSSFHLASFQEAAHTSSQLSLDAYRESFSRDAASSSAALTLLGAGFSYQLGRSATWALFSNTPARFVPRVLAPIVGLHLETASIHVAHHLTGASLATEHSSSYRSFYSTLFDMGGLKSIGILGRSFSSPLRHLSQSVGMVAIHRLLSAIRLTPAAPSSDFFREVLEAEVVNLQMETSAVLGNRLGGAHLHLLQRSLHVRENEISVRSSGILGDSLSVFASHDMTRHDMARWEKTMRPSRIGAYFERQGLSFLARWIRTYRLWSFERNLSALSPRERFARVKVLMNSLTSQNTSQAQVDFLVEALKRSYSHLSPDQNQRCGEFYLKTSQASQDPSYKIRWLLALRDVFPYLQGLPSTVRLEVMQEITKSIVSPFSDLANVAYPCFQPALVCLDRSELLKLPPLIRSLDFHPVSSLERASLERVQEMLDRIFDQLQMTRRENQMNAGRLEEARLLGAYLSHDVFNLGLLAHRRLLPLLLELPEREAKECLNSLPDSLPKDFLSNLRWVEEYERRRVNQDVSPSSMIQTWEESRYASQMRSLQSQLQILNFPQGGSEIRAQAAPMRALEDLYRLQGWMRQRFTSKSSEELGLIQTWWNRAGDAERWLILQLCVGSRGYWKLKGREAMRLRNLASMGLSSETGVASKRPVIRDEDEVLFVLGNHNSVSVPQGFIEEFGISEAAEYLMLHHTHPSYRDDFNEIYPSSHIEGSGSGDLYSMLDLSNRLQASLPFAFSVSHEDGGSIFVLREKDGNKHLDVYTGRRNISSDFTLAHPRLLEVRNRIRHFSQQNGMAVHFWEVPFDWVERVQVPNEEGQNPYTVAASQALPISN